MYLFILNIPNWLLCLSIIFILMYKYLRANHDYFIKLNVAHEKPTLLFGSFKDLVLKRKSFSDILTKQYKKYKCKSYFGIFHFRLPILVVIDPALIRSITVTDFDSFPNHRSYFMDGSVMDFALGMMKDEQWRNMRETLSPVFDSRNICMMFYLIEECCQTAKDNLRNGKNDAEVIEVDLKDFVRRFALDVVTGLAFGVRPNSLLSSPNEFLTKAMNMLEVTPMMLCRLFMYGNFPGIMRFLKIPFLNKDFLTYFHVLVNETIEFRKKHKIQHFDIIQLFIEKEGVDSNSQSSESSSTSVTNDEIIAQCFMSFFGGFSKTTDLLSCALLELAVNIQVQEKLLKEIQQIQMTMNGKKVSYDTLNDLPYLDMVVFETLRKWPNQTILDRVCKKPYRLYDKSNKHWIDIKPGDTLWIPIINLHQDPAYFPDPEKFCPERFSESRRGFIKPYSYLPFGIGPRNCIGAKFALILMKAAIYSILTEFHIEPESDQVKHVKASRNGYFIQPESYKVRLRQRH